MNGKKIVVRAGVPQPYGAIMRSAHQARIPVLFSANAFARPSKRPTRIGEFKLPVACQFGGFNLQAAQALPADLDAALDSAGFVAANRYGGYRWTVQQFYDLVAARDWTWHAAMDFCMEPELTGSKLMRMIRMQATAQSYFACVNEAKKRNLQMPMPVLQGWEPEDYLRSCDLLAINDWPELVGIGSVCRRNVGGKDGIANIIETLDRVLPEHTKFHLFGVKGGAVKELGNHPRFESIDSMAWDFKARCDHRIGRTQAIRSQAMLQWQESQTCIHPLPWRKRETYAEKSRAGHSVESLVQQAVADWYAENIGDHGYEEVRDRSLHDAQMVIMKIRHFGIKVLEGSDDAVEMAVLEALN